MNDSSSNVRTLRSLDVVRCLVMGMSRLPNHAVTAAGIQKSQSFHTFLAGVLRRRIQPRPGRDALFLAQEGSFRAIAATTRRSGVRCWELSHLYASPEAEDGLAALLEQTAAASALGGAERVFLRLTADSAMIPLARRAGFFPCFGETLYHGQTPAQGSGRGLFDVDSHSVRRSAEHDHALFRLYNAATPVSVRQLVGMTLDQWLDSREPPAGRRRERVAEVDGELRGWIATSLRSGVGRLEITLHPEYSAFAPDMVDYALSSLTKATSVYAVVPDYAPPLTRALEERGFKPGGEFSVLVKSNARMVRRPAAAQTSLAAE